jgi:hypothetical protein
LSPGKRIAIVQSCYNPWKGYFDMINAVDEFILLDDVQFTKRDWRNRNVIKTPSGPHWITIPVQTKGRHEQRIDQTAIVDADWRNRHWKTLVHNYASAPCFDEQADVVRRLYDTASHCLLSKVNRTLLEGICSMLGISTRLTWSTDYAAEGAKTDRLISLCRAAGARSYLSGPRARLYLDEERFHSADIGVEYMDYSGYPEYLQLYPPFEHAVTILDLIFTTGRDAPRFMKTFAGSGAVV